MTIFIKPRIKILVNELGIEKIKSMVEDKYKNFANKTLELSENQIKSMIFLNYLLDKKLDFTKS